MEAETKDRSAAPAVVADASNSVLVYMAEKNGMRPATFEKVLRNTVIKPDKNGREATAEELQAFLMVAKEYDLNPITREIFAFPDKNGITPIVSIDGWSNLINSHPAFDGMEFRESENVITGEDHKPCPEWIEVAIYRKDRTRPIVVREKFHECYRPAFKGRDGYVVKGPWQTHTSRFLRHKTMIQGARLAFGFAGIYDPDEGERIREAQMRDITPAKPLADKLREAKQLPSNGFNPRQIEEEAGIVTGAADTFDEARATRAQEAAADHSEGEEPGDDQTPASDDGKAADRPSYTAGGEARRKGLARKIKGDFDEESFLAGWDDADADIRAEEG